MKELNPNRKILTELFDDNIRAEWSSDYFSELFVSPTYLDKLESVRPSVLVGGRGTGKTTALRSLKYDLVFERLAGEGLNFSDQNYLGILVRMNKNQVRAFDGEDLDERKWQKYFAHYFNLLVCLQLTNLGIWLEEKNNKSISTEYLKPVCISLGISPASTFSELEVEITTAIAELEVFINNPVTSPSITLSIAESPLKNFVNALSKSGLSNNKVIFCCIDEYENLLDYQQGVLNTYIKHAEPPLTYKVGVRKNGLRNRQTMDTQDLFKTPDDYAEIEIADEGFDYFARAVADARLRFARSKGLDVPDNLNDFLDDLTIDEEALKLGAAKVSKYVLNELKKEDSDLSEKISLKKPSEIYFLQYWSEGNIDKSLSSHAASWLNDEATWSTRLTNHQYASLFWLSKGKKGARIRKYYCGSRIFLSLAAGNIRFFLELIHAAINAELKQESISNKTLVLSPKSQTIAVTKVGSRQLNQLEGLADHGVRLKRLVLAIGKVFFEYARTPIGRSPEVTSFVLKGADKDVSEIRRLLSEGVTHLAFESEPRTKATTNNEMRDEEFRLHRIFTGFFEISHRKKRRTVFDAVHLLGVLDSNPSKSISTLLEGVEQSDDDKLPEQLAFFSTFYHDK